MKAYITYFLFLGCFAVSAQENYTVLTEHALKTMWDSKDSEGYRLSLSRYEDAFAKFPDSIDGTGLYKAAVLAGELKEYDKAFYYLSKLIEIDMDTTTGLPGWSSITGKYATSEYKNLLEQPRWTAIKDSAIFKRKLFFQKLKEAEDEFYSTNPITLNENTDAVTLYNAIKNSSPYKSKNNRDYSISFPINDSTQTSFLVHLPQNYNPEEKYPLLFFLHGAVRHNSLAAFQPIALTLGEWNRFYTKYADQNKVILVFPSGNKDYNWMTSDQGFYMIPEILKRIKTSIHVDDNKVFISGHSNGATGSFSYLMKQPTQFAGFYGFNTYPKVFTGGTFIENSKNRSFINFSTDQDYYYPPNANDAFTKMMHAIGSDYKEYRYLGFPHWFPEFDESEPAYEILFNDLKKRQRNPFPKEITWEFDASNYGAIDWLSDIKLDTLQTKSDWHKTLNFKIDKWLEYGDDEDDDTLYAKDVDKDAFNFPRKSGKIKAEYLNNVFTIETSCIKSFAIAISPEMVNLRKKVKVYVNGSLCFNQKVTYNREILLQNFKNNQDRSQIWVNTIKLNL